MPTSARRVGLVSGSFDPMTVAHAALAEALRAEAADPVLLVYSPRTIPKDPGAEPPLLRPEERLASVAAWCESRPGLLPAVCSHGLYVDQAEAAARAFPAAEIVLALGADKVLQLFDPSWYEDPDQALDRLFQRASVVYAPRGGQDEAVEQVVGRHGAWTSRVTRVALPDDLSDVSSSEVRRRVRGGQDVASSVPPEILPFLPPS